MVRSYIGLGSNLQNPLNQLQQALVALSELPQSRLAGRSSFYQSKPMGPQDQADFINAVVELQTCLSPQQLLDALQAIELHQQRRRDRHWGPRTLDLDILLYADSVLNSHNLTIPHPGLYLRNFVLYPLFEIAPDLVFPDGRCIRQLLEHCQADGLKRLEERVSGT